MKRTVSLAALGLLATACAPQRVAPVPGAAPQPGVAANADTAARAAGSDAGAANPAARWWSQVSVLAHDSMQGRDTGSEEYRRAALYVAQQFADAGLRAGGTEGYLQPVPFVVMRLDTARSSLAVTRRGKQGSFRIGEEAILLANPSHPAALEAPMVFVGHGVSLRSVGHDDLAGVDLRGKIAVVLPELPRNLPPTLLAHALRSRPDVLRRAGAVGMITLRRSESDAAWSSAAASSLRPRFVLPSGDSNFVSVSLRESAAGRLLEGSGHTLADLRARAEAGERLRSFAIPGSLRAKVSMEQRPIQSPNVVGILPGSDPALRNEYVVLTAHLDHVGIGTPVRGDSLYNGAMDNASGVATLIETARTMAEHGVRPRRSVVFLAVTGEEKGLLGSTYFARQPTVPRSAIVANLNTDMYLPIIPLRGVFAYGSEESDLGDDLAAVLRDLGLDLYLDPEPEQVRFVRSDQYSFIREGIPALALKVGYQPGSPEMRTAVRWREERYHQPSDDLTQPVDLQSAADFNAMYVRLVSAVANRQSRPQWRANSVFRR